MLFKNVIGQFEVKQKLIEMVALNRLSHALLFLGKEGSGAFPLAMAFAQYVSLLPTYKQTSIIPNGLFPEANEKEVALPHTALEADLWMQQQPSFIKGEKLIHPDIHFTFPVISKKPGTPPISSDFISEWREFLDQNPYGNIYDWLQFIGAENKQGNITAQECNDMIRKLNLKSYENGYKILVLWMPEYLGKEGNKLLKLIEEPPADTLFILVAENDNNILSTIVSRCQLVKVPALDASSLKEALIDRNKIEPEQAKKLASTCAGNYREALHMVQHADEDYQRLLIDWLNATLKNQVGFQLKIIDEISRMGRENQKQFLRYFTHLLEMAIKSQFMQQTLESNTLFYSKADMDLALKINKAMTLEQKEAIAQQLDKASYYIERNAHSKLLFHSLTIKIYYIVKNNIVISL
ncbi:MAG: DNA polymerase III subunit delta' [Flavisolibacter sp.]